MRVELTWQRDSSAVVLSDLPDESSVAQLLADDSCTAVTVERWDGYSYRYRKVFEA